MTIKRKGSREDTFPRRGPSNRVRLSRDAFIPTGRLGTFVSAAPQQADYRFAAGFTLVIASAVTPQGDTNAAEYLFGTHAQALYNAEAIKSFVRPSASAPVVQPQLGQYFTLGQQSYVDSVGQVWKAVVAGATSQPVPFTQAAPQLLDLSVQAVFQKPLVGPQGSTVRPFTAGPQQVDLTQQAFYRLPPEQRQGPVPPFTIGLPQDNTYQIPASITPAQPAATTTPNPVSTFFSVPPQTEDRPTQLVWQSNVSGQTPPVIPSVYASPQQVDLTQQAQLFQPAIIPPVVSYAIRQFYASPQVIDLTQQGWILGTAPGRQGPVPPMLSGGQPQADTSQLAALIRMAALVPPAAPPNLHKLYYDVSSGRLFWRVSTTANPIEIVPL